MTQQSTAALKDEDTSSSSIGVQFGHSHCIMCGPDNPLSLKLDFTPEKSGKVSTVFHGNPNLQGYEGLMHGGILASLIDAAMTHCLFHKGIEAVTADLQIRYAHPVPYDSEMKISAELQSQKGPIYNVKADIHSDGKMAVWAKAKFVTRD